MVIGNLSISFSGNTIFFFSASLLLLNREFQTVCKPRSEVTELRTSHLVDLMIRPCQDCMTLEYARVCSIAATKIPVLASSGRVTHPLGSPTPFAKRVFGKHHLTKSCSSHAKHLEIRPRSFLLQEVYRNGFINQVILN